ncbi:MAG: HlyD family efflux transporter periplasmic adaptor subunit [Planctomycetota bacterium]
MSVQQFESRLQQLDDAIRRQSDGASVAVLARDALSCLAPTVMAALLLSDQRQTERSGPKILLSTGESPEDDPAIVTSLIAGLEHYRIVSDRELQETRHSSGEPVAQVDHRSVNRWIACRRPLSSAFSAITVFQVSEEPRDARLVRDAVEAISDTLQSMACRILIESLLRQQRCHQKLSPVIQELLLTTDAQNILQRFAEKTALLLPQTRVSICHSSDSETRLTAISGTVSHDAHAAAVQVIKDVVEQVLHDSRQQSRWLLTDQHDVHGSANYPDAEDRAALATVLTKLAVAGVTAIRCEPLESDHERPTHFLVFEHFGAADVVADEDLIHAVADCGRSVVLRQDVMRIHSGQQASGLTRRRIMAAALVSGFACLWLIPARFEIEVSGQLFPSERRRVFAPDDGMVEEVLVLSDQRVLKDAPLLRIRNPERELELNRVLGDIETTASRLQAVRTTRSGSSTRPATEVSESGSEEQELEQKLRTLREEQVLLEQQIESLTVRSPVDGLVYQRRLQEQLTARPVQRGQMLLEIGNDSTGWIAELNIPDDVVGYVKEAAGIELPVEFVRAGRSGHPESATLISLSDASHIEDGQVGCSAFARLNASMTNEFRPGESVTARIDCGRRSLGFVWFRELIEFCQKKRFEWL